MSFLKRVVSKQLGEILKEAGVITDSQLREALEIQKQKGGLIGEILVLLDYATEEQIAQALTIQYGFPYLSLDSYEIEREVINIVPVDVAKKYSAIPIDKIGTTLTLAMVNPLNAGALEELEKVTNCTIQFFVITSSSFKHALEKYYSKK